MPVASVNEIIGWDVENWSRAMCFWQRHVNLLDTKVLELGCGGDNGGLSLWAAKLGASEVICSDYVYPRKNTQKIHDLNGYSGIISYAQVNALEIPYCNEFDLVCFKSILGGIVRKGGLEIVQQIISGATKALKRGGYLVFAENLVGTPLHQFFRKRYLQRAWRYFESNELPDIIGGHPELQLVARKNVGFLGCFGRREVQRTILGKLDKYFFERFVPEEYRYIQFIIARKK